MLVVLIFRSSDINAELSEIISFGRTKLNFALI